MIWPVICIDNFFQDPIKVKEFAYSLKYGKGEEGRWPGTRTNPLHEVDFRFFKWSTKKMISAIYPMNFSESTWVAEQSFQRIPGSLYKNKGWVHRDNGVEFTAIVYLSNHRNCGTSIYRPKILGADTINENEKRNFYKNIENLNDKQKKEEKDLLKQNNDQFEKILEIDSVFNRLVMFDANNYHAAENFSNEGLNEDRLTLITFFSNVVIPNIKYPLTEMRRI